MRRITIANFCVLLSIFLSILGCSRTEDKSLKNSIIVEFTTEVPDGGSGTLIGSFENPIVIMEKEEVVFKNTSRLETIYEIGFRVEAEYSGDLLWRFPGGNPESSTEGVVSVRYDKEGKYNVILQAKGGFLPINESFETFFPTERTFEGYVCVVAKPEPEPFCIVKSEEVDNGRSTFFDTESLVIDGNSRTVISSVDNLLDGELTEQSFISYDDFGLPVVREFRSPTDDLLGRDLMTYDGSQRLLSNVREDAEENLLYKYDLMYNSENDMIPKGGTLSQSNGTDVFTVDFTYTLDPTGFNIEKVDFGTGGYVEYEFDDNPKVFTNAGYLESFPLIFNKNNVTRETTYDANGTQISSITNTYSPGTEENCHQSDSYERNDNGVISEHRLGYFRF